MFFIMCRHLRSAQYQYFLGGTRFLGFGILGSLSRICRSLFNSDFSGMANILFDYADFEKTRITLIENINRSLSVDDKKFLLSFFAGTPDWTIFRVPHAQELPAIKWKLINLNKLDSIKRDAQIEFLKAIF